MLQARATAESSTTNSENTRVGKRGILPIFRWIGGKQQLLRSLLHFCPSDVESRAYCEPFLGAASLFLGLRPKNALLADANSHLINTYRAIRDEPGAVWERLTRFIKADSAEFFYSLRAEYNRGRPSAIQAARFIYLNRTCFNGVFRVNTRGEFNVPYGYRKSPKFPTHDELVELGTVFRGAVISTESYQSLLPKIEPDSFIYLDPPYPPISDTAYFQHYTMDRFSEFDQHRLASLVRDMDRRGSLFLMSNADTPMIRELYRSFNITTLSVNRWVTCKAVKHRVSEVLITNYPVPTQPGRSC
jgi:DNA adenine methylase